MWTDKTHAPAISPSECRRAQERLKLEIELIDVVLGEDVRRSEENLAAIDDFELAEFAGLKFRRAGL